MNYIEFRNKYLGKAIDFDKNYGAQCFDVYRQYCQELGFKQSPPSAGAKDIWNNYLPECFDKVANTPTGTPPQGSVIIWGVKVGQYGHVAICDHSSTTDFVSIDQNWPVDNGTGVVHYVTHNYNGVLGWLIPKIKVLEENMTDNEKILLDFIRANKITEGMLRQGYGYITDNVDKKVQDLEDANFKLQQSVSDLKESLANEKKSSSGWHSALNTANLEIKSLNSQLLSATDKLTVNQLFKLIVKKLTKK